MNFSQTNTGALRRCLALLLCAALCIGLAACGASDATPETVDPDLQDDSRYQLTAADVETPLDGGGATVALAVDAAGVEDGGPNAAVWRGVQTFAANFNYTAESFTAADDSDEARQDALRAAASSGAALVVCQGDGMATALFSVQDSYPSVSYLLLDAEPHNADYTVYRTAANVHCVLFQEEQAGFLAGYAAVTDGYTSLAVLGAEEVPALVRYATGFLQGAQSAADLQGEQIEMRIWFCSMYDANDDLTQRVSGWFEGGAQLVMAAGGNLFDSCLAAAQATGGRVITVDVDRMADNEEILTDAVKCFSRTVQSQLYSFYTAGWDQAKAGASERVGVSENAVELPTTAWRFSSFSLEDYRDLYENLKSSALKVERNSDLDQLPVTPNVTVTLKG